MHLKKIMSKIKLTQEMIMKTLDWTYDKVVTGIPGFDSAIEIAENYLSKTNDPKKCAKTLIRWQNTKAGTSGFLTGVGGIIYMPLTVPANFASVIYIQMRMVAAIAHMGGYDVKDDRVKTLIYACLAGNAAKDIVKDVGIIIGNKMTLSLIKKIPGKTLTKINQKVGFRILTKFGSTGAINLGKAVPFVGGFVGGTFDILSTNTVGKIAKKTFLSGDNDNNSINEVA